MSKAYYNEFDKFAAAWLRELIKEGVIAPGDVDERSIEDVLPSDLAGYTQCHFFAGIGVWSYALRNAGWSDDKQVWTGSAPCQPFSTAGKRKGIADERHLWPAFFHLVEQCKPGVIFGEQVEAAVRQGWLDLVQADLEGIDYTFGAVGTPAAGFGAPHGRHRLYFLAESQNNGYNSKDSFSKARGRWAAEFTLGSATGIVADCTAARLERPTGTIIQRNSNGLAGNCTVSELGDTKSTERRLSICERRPQQDSIESFGPSETNGFWRDSDWLWCRDEKYRPVEPGTFPLVNGATNKVGRLRGYGNAIVAPQATAFIQAYLEATNAVTPAQVAQSIPTQTAPQTTADTEHSQWV